MNILAVVAHPDDELLGCGATLKRLADAGHSVYSVVLCAPADARHNRPSIDRLQEVSQKAAKAVGIRDSLHYEFPNIKFNAVPHLDMVQAIEKAILKFRPEWIFTHHAGDLNIDHRICYETTMAAVMLPQRLSHDLPPTMIRRVFLFEVVKPVANAPQDPLCVLWLPGDKLNHRLIEQESILIPLRLFEQQIDFRPRRNKIAFEER